MKLVKYSFAVALFCLVAQPVHAAVELILANNPSPGDSYTSGLPSPGGNQALTNAPGWLYNNVRNAATIGINTTQPRSGNASVSFENTNGSDKADIEFYNTNPNGGFASMGTLANLTSLSYDWYRASGGTAASHLHASLRLFYDADGDFGTTNDRGQLIYERAYNGGVDPGTEYDVWNSDNILDANFWMTNFGNPNGSILEVFDRTLAEWVSTPNPNPAYPTLSASTVIYGLSSGIGSGWNGTFEGFVDNITIGFGTLPATTYNFEVQADGVVPEPMTLAVWSVLGLCGSAFAWRAKRRQLAA